MDYETSQILTDHGCFSGRLHKLSDVVHVTAAKPMSRTYTTHFGRAPCTGMSIRWHPRALVGPVQYRDLVDLKADFMRKWHKKRQAGEVVEGRGHRDDQRIEDAVATPRTL